MSTVWEWIVGTIHQTLEYLLPHNPQMLVQQIVGAAFSLTVAVSVLMVGKRETNGWLVGVIAQVCMFTFAIFTHTWTLIFGPIVVGSVMFTNWLDWRKPKEEEILMITVRTSVPNHREFVFPTAQTFTMTSDSTEGQWVELYANDGETFLGRLEVSAQDRLLSIDVGVVPHNPAFDAVYQGDVTEEQRHLEIAEGEKEVTAAIARAKEAHATA